MFALVGAGLNREQTSFEVAVLGVVDDGFPIVVECGFADALGEQHRIIEKVPVISDADELVPPVGYVFCEVVRRWTDEAGRELVAVSTEQPFYIASTTDKTEFTLSTTQLLPRRETS